MTLELMTSARRTLNYLPADAPAEIELLDLETWEVPRLLFEDDRLKHIGGQGRRQPRTEPELDDDQ
jgi:hypothetical protein